MADFEPFIMPNNFSTFEADYAAMVERINTALSTVGWVVNPTHIIGLDMEDVIEVVKAIDTGVLPIDKDGYDRVCAIVQQCTFAPNHRAFYLWRASQLPYLQDFTHYLERATLRFFSRDYFSASLLLITAVEGVMRRHAAFSSPTGDHRKITRLIDKRHSTAPQPFNGRYGLYRKWLLYAIEEWLFKGTEQARGEGAMDLTAMFRSNALHGETAGAFYAAADCTRLFALFDLYVETLTCETGLGYANFIPEEGTNAFIDGRTEMYLRLLLDPSLRSAQEREELLMREHRCYVPETRQPDIAEVIVKNAVDYNAKLNKALNQIRTGSVNIESGTH